MSFAIFGPRPFTVHGPAEPGLPFVYASPHSGSIYPADLLADSRLDPMTLRRSEDAFVQELFGAAPKLGAPLIEALFPRVYLDPNREPYELDQAMFADSLPAFANTTSARVSVGLGTIARVVSNGAEIYRLRLRVADAEARIEGLYFPYHTALKQLLLTARAHFGGCVLVDCHSMPSTGGPMDEDSGRARCDIVLGDRFGMSCDPRVTDLAEAVLRRLGYRVARNDPYAGGFVTQNYGRPSEGLHALQIEINRALYMDEGTIRPNAGFARLKANLTTLIGELGTIEAALLAPRGERYSQAAQ
jgi:N-formylglutamate amidohydrolase